MLSRGTYPLRNLADIERFETEKTFEERCGLRSVYDIFLQGEQRFPLNTALTFLMTGEDGETAERCFVRRSAEGRDPCGKFLP